MKGQYFPVGGKNYLVLGLARTGRETLRWLQKNGAQAIGWDDNAEARALAAQDKLPVAPSPEFAWEDVSALVQSPGISPEHPFTQQAIEAGIPVITDCDLYRAANPHIRFVGITGTNGKSTTTALVTHILKEAGMEVECGGNIGEPVLGLPDLSPSGVCVLELSSYQLELS